MVADSLRVPRTTSGCIITPDTGSAEHIPFPDPYTTNICFGGDELRMAYITLSQSGQLIEVPWPRAGLALNYLNK